MPDPVPVLPHTISARVLGLRPALSPAQARIADEVLRDPAGVATSTIGDLAARCRTSLPSVTRFCVSLGLTGYAELRLALAAESARSAARAGDDATAWERGAGTEVGPGDSLDDVLRTLLRADSLALEETVAELDRDALRTAVDVLAEAARVDLYAVSGSAAVAEDFRLRMHRIGRGASCWSDVHNALTSAVLLGSKDVAVGISHSGETSEVVEPLERAGEHGARTIALTNYPRSALARIADIVLLTAARDVTFRTGGPSARHAQMIVLDALYIGIAQRDYKTAEQAFETTAAAVAGHRTGPRRIRPNPSRSSR
jgi:DNA-binding MurR/RpiR family transcriptional regulator